MYIYCLYNASQQRFIVSSLLKRPSFIFNSTLIGGFQAPKHVIMSKIKSKKKIFYQIVSRFAKKV